MGKDLPFIPNHQIWGTLPSFLIRTLQTLVHFHKKSKKTYGTCEQGCLLGSQTLDGHQRTASPSWTRTYPSSPIIKFEAHFPVSSSQHFKLWYIFTKKTWKRMVPVNKGVCWVARRSMDTNKLHSLHGQGPALHPQSSNLRHTSQFNHQNTSNFGTFSSEILQNVWHPWTRVSAG
jgi:hypothetical protein